MNCPSCEFDNRQGAKFCKKCGTKLELKCPSCSAPLDSDNLFCDECGHNLSKPKDTIDYSELRSYTPKTLADKILTSRNSIEGERKTVTVFFADVAGFTSISEKLDAEDVHSLMDGCFKIILNHIHTYEGTVIQFTGDGAMAIFGAPVAHEEHAQSACHAALAIQKELQEYGKKVEGKYGIPFKIRIGLNSGSVIVGSIGDDLKMDYTAIGDTVNLASRMESTAETGTIQISINTYKIVHSYFETEPLGESQIKGKEKPQITYKLLKQSDIDTRIGASIAKGLTRFVGRKKSIPVLNSTFNKVKSGSGQVVGIVGEAGVGKSRLLLEFIKQLPADEFSFLQGQCLHFGGPIAYLPLLEIIRSYYCINEEDPENTIQQLIRDKTIALDEKLQTAISPLCELLSVKAEDERYSKLDPKIKKVKTFEAIRDLLVRESQNKPLILIIEDLHWIDNTSQEVLGSLISGLARARILLLLLYRPEYTHQWGSKSFYTKIGLNQLGLDSSLEMIKAILQESDTARGLKELILGKAAGNPLFLEEFTRNLLENSTIEKVNDIFVVRKKIDIIQVPETVQGIIAARMDRLEENLKRTLQTASVVGRDFSFRILELITDTKDDLKSHLQNLLGLEFIYEKQLFPDLEYIFKHTLIQEVAYNSLLQQRRKEIHENIGQAIENLYTDRLEDYHEMLAHHYALSDNLEKAFLFLKLSGDKSVDNFAYWEAYRFYLEAIAALQQLSKTDCRINKEIEIRCLIGFIMVQLTFPDEMLENLEEGEKLAGQVDDAKNLVIFLNYKTLYYQMKGELKQGLEYGEKSFQQAVQIGDVEQIAQTSMILVIACVFLGYHKKIVEIATIATAQLEETDGGLEQEFGWGNVYTWLCGYHGLALAYMGEFESGEKHIKKGLHHARRVQHQLAEGYCNIWYQNMFMQKGEGRLAVKHGQEATKILEETNVNWMLIFSLFFTGHGYCLLGDFIKAGEYLKISERMMSDVRPEIGAGTALLNFCYICMESGQLKKAENYAQKAFSTVQKNSEEGLEGFIRILLGRIKAKRNSTNTDMAAESIQQGIKKLEEINYRARIPMGLCFLGELHVDSGHTEKALENLEKAKTLCREMGIDYWRGRIYEVYAKLHQKQGDLPQARGYLTGAINIMKELKAYGWVERYEKELEKLY